MQCARTRQAALSKKKICNRKSAHSSTAQKMKPSSTLAFISLITVPVVAINNGLLLTPPMGFANWNVFGCNYDDATFRSIADAFVSTGLAAAGYRYMLVQECITPAGARDAQGRMVVDAAKFPHGFKDLCDYFHAKGLLCGIYTDVAHLTCANYEGSGPGPSNPAGHWAIDALTFASWGVDMIEADFCNTEGTNLTALQLYQGARDAIAAATAGQFLPIAPRSVLCDLECRDGIT